MRSALNGLFVEVQTRSDSSRFCGDNFVSRSLRPVEKVPFGGIVIVKFINF